MKDRIKKIMESQKMTQQEFADCIKIAPATLSSIFTGRTRPTITVVEAIKNKFANISTDWLMFGVGPMFNTDESLGDKKTVSTQTSADESVSGGPGESDGSCEGLGAFPLSNNNISSAETADKALKQPESYRNIDNVAIKRCDGRQRKIVEIRIFFDDHTWETFVPKAR